MRSAAPAKPSADDQTAIGEVARGGALNLVGNAVYGGGNFLLLAIVTTQLGVAEAGVFLVAVALFNIVAKVCEIGAATGLIRTISRDRATGRQHELRANMRIAIASSFAASLLAALIVWVSAPWLAELFSGSGEGADVERLTDVLRAVAPFLTLASVYSVLVYGSRGFNTMVPQVCIEKIGRALAQPIAVLAVVLAGGGVVAAAGVWAAVQFVWVVPAAIVFGRLLHRAEGESDHTPVRVSMPLTRAFLSYSLPRALGQTFQVAVLWMDTLVIASLVGTTQAGIYAAGTRYLLVGLFTAEAIMHVLGPRISALLAVNDREGARSLYATGTAWQTSITWSVYLIVIGFSVPLLRVFGPEYISGSPALVFLSVAMLFTALCGPSDTIILMSGRARLSLFNAFIAVGLNLAGNLLLVPRYGITAAGVTWAVTLVIAAALPAYQARRDLGIHPWSSPVRAAVLCTAVGVGVPVLATWLLLGPTLVALIVASVLGLFGFLVLLHRFGTEIHLDTLMRSLLPSGRRGVRADIVGSASTIS